MKLPIQAQPVSRKVSSTMISKKAANAVGASWSCSECGLSLAQCGFTLVTEGPKPFWECIMRSRSEECADCYAEVQDWILKNAGVPYPGGDGNVRHLV
jgi:ribosomal protein L37AE/L43A